MYFLLWIVVKIFEKIWVIRPFEAATWHHIGCAISWLSGFYLFWFLRHFYGYRCCYCVLLPSLIYFHRCGLGPKYETLFALLDFFLSGLLTFWHLVLSLNIALFLLFSTSTYLLSEPSLSLLINMLNRIVLRTEPCGRPLKTVLPVDTPLVPFEHGHLTSGEPALPACSSL